MFAGFRNNAVPATGKRRSNIAANMSTIAKATCRNMGKKTAEARFERCVADKFCEFHDGGPRVIQANNPPAPDFMLALGDQEIMLELAQYRDQGPKNAGVERDDEFKNYFLNKWLYESDFNQFDVEFVYRTSDTGAPLIPAVRKGQEQADKVITELKSLITSLGREACGAGGATIVLVPQSDIKKYQRLRAMNMTMNMYRANEDFRTLAKYFSEIHVRYTDGVKVGCPHTSISEGHYVPDWDEMRKVLKSKHEKLAQYRSVAGGRPVCLLFYEDGGYTGRIPPATLDEVIQFLRAEISKFQDRFDEVWWGHDMFCPTASLHPISY